MQEPIPANVVSVPVSIDAVGPSGQATHLADVTSDMSGTFSYTWNPTTVGDYKITATFMDDDSYGSSWAQTYATVAAAPTTDNTGGSTSNINTDDIIGPLSTYIIAGLIAIIIMVALVGVMLLARNSKR